MTDHLGNTRFMWTVAGNNNSDFHPFGGERPIHTSGTPTNYKFTGKERDSESSLDYFGARYFGASLGRFMSADEPLADQHKSDPQTWNLIAYARNNPLANTDPDGQACVSIEGGPYHDDNSGGQSCAEAQNDHSPAAVVTATPGSWWSSLGWNFFFGLSNAANDFFRPVTNAMDIRPSYMENVPTGSGSAAQAGAGIAGIVEVLIGPAGETITIETHAAQAMGRARSIQSNGAQSNSPWGKVLRSQDKSIVYVIQKGMASGKDLAIARDAITGAVKTVMVNSKAIRPRFIPIPWGEG